MILVTGGTGFIGKVLIKHLVEAGYSVRVLIRPSPRSPDIPRNVPVEVALCALNDVRGLRSAMVGVETVFHLAGVERRGAYASLNAVDIYGTRSVAETARDAGVKRLFYLSHLDADRSSAYPVFKAKAYAEEFIKRSGLDFTIFRTSIVFGPQDGFTTGLARMLSVFPFIFLIPGDGNVLLQPLWVEDLVTCLTWALDDNRTINEIYEIGGPEYLSLSNILALVMDTTGMRRKVIPTSPPYLRGLTVLMEAILPGSPISVFWLDYLANNRTCTLDTLPRIFSLMPARMSQSLDYLKGVDWRMSLLRTLFRRK